MFDGRRRSQGILRLASERLHPVSRRELFRGVGALGTAGALGTLPSSAGSVRATGLPPVTATELGFVYVSHDFGSDRNPGTFEAPLQTIQAAVDLAERAGGGSHILVGSGIYQETVTISGGGIRISGCGDRLYGTVVQAPHDRASIFVIRGADNWIENLCVTGSSSRWDAVAFDLDHADGTRLAKVSGQNDNLGMVPSPERGGVALRITNSEGIRGDQLAFSWFRIAVHLLAEASDNAFTDMRGSINWQALVQEPGGGGNLFQHWKTTGSGNREAPSVVVDLRGNGNLFVGTDWDEARANLVRIGGEGHHVFVGATFAPNTTVEVASAHNTFLHPTVLNTLILRGDHNRCQDAFVPGGVIRDLGVGNLIENPDGRVVRE